MKQAIFEEGAEGEEGWRKLAEKYGGLVKPEIVFFGVLPDLVLLRHYFRAYS